MRYENRTPCASCPYRKDAPLKKWDRSHFVDLLANDADPHGAPIYGCHGTRKLPEGPDICAGWLLDQVKRGIPTIAMRMAAIFNPAARAAIAEVHDGGHALYASVKAMCRANGVRSRKQAPRLRDVMEWLRAGEKR